MFFMGGYFAGGKPFVLVVVSWPGLLNIFWQSECNYKHYWSNKWMSEFQVLIISNLIQVRSSFVHPLMILVIFSDDISCNFVKRSACGWTGNWNTDIFFGRFSTSPDYIPVPDHSSGGKGSLKIQTIIINYILNIIFSIWAYLFCNYFTIWGFYW